MSHQHFYSRVPARVSLFNKRDGFDTFAHSAGLSADFILKELSVAYAGKLEIQDPIRLRRGEVPCVYSQAVLPSGEVVQTTLTHLAKDFTGERSAYLAHSLVLTEGEKESLFALDSAESFNSNMFLKDISVFDITSRNALPNRSVEDKVYATVPLLNPLEVIDRYSPDMVKSFIFSIVSAILGEDRDVYFRLPYADSELSERALEFINAVMSILPYSMRRRLSFVSFISRPDAYNGFKLKCVGNHCAAVAPENGVFYDFATGEVVGQSAEYKQFNAHASFLYSLFKYGGIRKDFHFFINGIEKKFPDFSFNIESFTDVIFMYWQCSGFYVESSVIVSDESMCNFLDVYGRFREGVEERYRVQAYRPLARYAEEQIAIPDGVYTRLSRLYPTECVAAKAVALDVILSLIHVDVMRERLFNFISRNYPREIPAVKEVVNHNLCRVFYGGFLQQRILGHFDAYFEREPVKTRDFIIDRLLLSIRTPEIQGQIVLFLERHYRSLTSAQRLKLCSTCLEMIPECDGLSIALTDLANKCFASDGGLASALSTGLLKALESELKEDGDGLLRTMISNTGFIENAALTYVVDNRFGTEKLVKVLSEMSAYHRALKLILLARLRPSISEEYGRILALFDGASVSIRPSTVYDIIEADKAAQSCLAPDMLKVLRERILYPALLCTLPDAFDCRIDKDGVDKVVSYLADRPELTESVEYSIISNYIGMLNCCKGGDTEGAFRYAHSLAYDNIKGNIGEYLSLHYDGADGDEADCTLKLLVGYLTEEKLDFYSIYSEYQKEYEEEVSQEGGIKTMIMQSDRVAAAEAIELIISCASAVCESSSEASALVLSEESGFKKAISEFVKSYGLGAGVLLKKKTEDVYYAIGDVAEEVIEDRNASIGSVDDAINLILRKK